MTVAADDFRRLRGEPTGKGLVEALQASPYRDIDIASKKCERMPVRDVEL